MKQTIMKRAFLLPDSMRSAIKMEDFCRQHKIACEVVPVPRQISSECGMCLEIDHTQAERVKRCLTESGFKIQLAHL